MPTDCRGCDVFVGQKMSIGFRPWCDGYGVALVGIASDDGMSHAIPFEGCVGKVECPEMRITCSAD